MSSDADSQLDVSGVCCPLPLIHLAKTIEALQPGQSVEITGNDPMFEPTIRDYCQAHNHEVIEATALANHAVSILIRVGA